MFYRQGHNTFASAFLTLENTKKNSYNEYMLKRIIYFIVILSLFPAAVNAQRPAAQTREDFSLYRFTRKNIESYYKHNNFSDPSHTNGWYRVDNFLKWVKQNEATLTKIFNEKYIDEYTSFPPKNSEDVTILAGFLGVYYTASHCKENLNQVHKVALLPAYNSSAGTRQINISLENSFVQTVDSGIHEGAHMIPFICYGIVSESPEDNLSELVPLSAQLFYGLPTHPSDSPQGTRNLVNELRGTQSLSWSYAQGLFALLQQDTFADMLDAQNLRPVTAAKLELSSFTLDVLLTDLIDIYRGKLLFNGQPVSLRKYVKLINVLPEEQENVAGFLDDFLNQLDQVASLPKGSKSREWKKYSDSYEKYLQKNTSKIKALLLNLLQPYPAPPAPTGYY